MDSFRILFQLVGPETVETKAAMPSTSASKLVLAATSLLVGLSLASLWGVIVGMVGHESFHNALKIPMLLAASALAALPFSLFVWKLFGEHAKTTDLFLSYAVASFAGCTTLVLLAPIVALYQHSSNLVGGWIGPVSVGVAFIVGMVVLIRTARKLIAKEEARRRAILPLLLLVCVQGASLAQLASIVSPVFGQRTPVGYGIDSLQRDKP